MLPRTPRPTVGSTRKFISSRILDDMESPAHWTAFSTGAPEVVDARAAQKTTEPDHSVAEISFSRERSRNGRQSLRLRMPTRLDVPGPKTVAGGAVLVFAGNSTVRTGVSSIASRFGFIRIARAGRSSHWSCDFHTMGLRSCPRLWTGGRDDAGVAES